MTSATILPLSTAQRGMWVGQEIAPKGAVFNIAEAIELHGAINPALMQQALLQVTTEMETLRVRIVQQAGLPRQMVMPAFTDPIRLHDFTGEADPRAAALRFMVAELSAPFDFRTCPVWVSAVMKVSDEHWFWYHRAHHIMLDGFSGGMVVQRVAELYSALRQGRPPSPSNFGALSTLIEAEAAYRKSERHEKDQAYWVNRMANLPEPVTLARRLTPQGGLLRSTAFLPQPVEQRLRERAAGLNVSFPRALIALVAAYYFRATGAEDLVFGLPVTARASGVVRRCPGMVANAVPIRLSMSGDATFESLIVQTSRAVGEALRHQQYRYEDLRRDLGLLNAGKQIARLGVNIEPFDYDLTFDGVRATPHNLSNAQMEDLTVFIYDRSDGSGLRIDFDANPGLYGAAELDAHTRRLCRLIEAATLDPHLQVGKADLLEPEERAQIVHGWNDTADPRPVPTVPEMVAAQAAASPDAVAVVCPGQGGRSLTFRELDGLSLDIARRFARQDIGPGDIVAVALPRSELVPAALLGILRAGAAYLPLDLDGPADRLSMMLADAGPVCVLTLRAHAGRFESEISCLLLDDAPEQAPEEPPLLHAPVASSPAYVIYTSGSTGRPKGVEVTHGNLSNFIEGMRQLLLPDASDCLLSVTTITFDIAAMELFLPLATGARVVVAGGNTVRDPLALGRLVHAHGVTMLQATPSLWRTILANGDARLSAVHALVGGEALGADLAARLVARARKATNLYGPTETTVWSTAMPLSADETGLPPIGRPIRNTRAYVLDARRQPVPAGSAGRLFIGGAGVSNGYLNQRALTDERFTPDPFAGDGARLYDTGDLARWREDGVLECLGRSDGQMKVRGHRVEPGEIETHLAYHDGVAEVAVAQRPDPAGEPALVAYMVATAGQPPSGEALRQHLAARVPSYMLPAVFVWLDEMPQTPHGKLDRKALPAPRWVRQEREPPAAARNETERRLLAIWQEVLGRRDIGVHDNFFELGGDSLSGAALFVAISEAFSREISFGSLFNVSTVAGLADLLDKSEAEDPLGTLLALRTEGSKPPLFCVHPIIGFGWPYAALMRHLDEDRPLYALQAKGLRDPAQQPGSIEAMAAHYLAEVRRVQPRGPYHLLGWSLGGLVAHAMAAQLRREREEVGFLGLLDSYPFEVADAEDADEGRLAQLALGFLGLQPAAGSAPPATLAELATHLCKEYDLLSQPLVQAVMRTEADIMERLEQVVRGNLAAARRYDPAPVDVDAVFCSAGKRTGAGLDGLVDYHPAAWQRRVRRLSVHEIDCHHQDMLSPHAAERIGAVLRAHPSAGPGAPPEPAHGGALALSLEGE